MNLEKITWAVMSLLACVYISIQIFNVSLDSYHKWQSIPEVTVIYDTASIEMTQAMYDEDVHRAYSIGMEQQQFTKKNMNKVDSEFSQEMRRYFKGKAMNFLGASKYPFYFAVVMLLYLLLNRVYRIHHSKTLEDITYLMVICVGLTFIMLFISLVCGMWMYSY